MKIEPYKWYEDEKLSDEDFYKDLQASVILFKRENNSHLEYLGASIFAVSNVEEFVDPFMLADVISLQYSEILKIIEENNLLTSTKKGNRSYDMVKVQDLWKIRRQLPISEEDVISNLPLVKSIVDKIYYSHEEDILTFEDMVDAGIIGLIDAYKRYDPLKKIGFGTFAYYRIKGAIMDEIRSLDLVPRSIRRKERKIRGLSQFLNRVPLIEESCNVLSYKIDEVMEVKGVSRYHFDSLEDVIFEDDGGNLHLSEVISDPDDEKADEITEKNEKLSFLNEEIAKLPERERLILVLYYYEGFLRNEIAEILGVTGPRVSQIHQATLHKLRNKFKEKYS